MFWFPCPVERFLFLVLRPPPLLLLILVLLGCGVSDPGVDGALLELLDILDDLESQVFWSSCDLVTVTIYGKYPLVVLGESDYKSGLGTILTFS